MVKQQDGPLKRVTLLKQDEHSGEIYDEWALDYEQDLIKGYGYVGPALAADIFAKVCKRRDALVMDFGCGTGLVGVELAKRGFTRIHGLDVSQPMLNGAKEKGVYQTLQCADLTENLSLNDAIYDSAICVGIFGNGHLTPEHLPEMLRVLKPQAPFVVYLNDLAYSSEGYADAFRDLHERGLWQIVAAEKSNYMSELERPGWAITAFKTE